MVARFVPIVRTFITVTAGVGRMDRRRYLTYSGIGAVIWAGGVTLLGYYLGSVSFVRDHVDTIFAIVEVVLVGGRAPVGDADLPGGWRRRRRRRPSAEADRPGPSRPEQVESRSGRSAGTCPGPVISRDCPRRRSTPRCSGSSSWSPAWWSGSSCRATRSSSPPGCSPPSPARRCRCRCSRSGVFVCAAAGNAVGYWTGRRFGRPWLLARAGRAAGHVERAERFYARYGWLAVVARPVHPLGPDVHSGRRRRRQHEGGGVRVGHARRGQRCGVRAWSSSVTSRTTCRGCRGWRGRSPRSRSPGPSWYRSRVGPADASGTGGLRRPGPPTRRPRGTPARRPRRPAAPRSRGRRSRPRRRRRRRPRAAPRPR